LITGTNISLLNDKIQNVRDQLENLFYKNRLIINTNKSKVLFFQRSRSIPSSRPLLCINDKVVVCSVDAKFLGICTAEDLSWATHTHMYVKNLVRLYIS
jgi:hypothetical protein